MVAEVALSVVLLTGAGLLLKSLVRLQDEDVGFDPAGVLVARMTLPESRYPGRTVQWPLFVREVLAEVEAVPGVSLRRCCPGCSLRRGAATMTYEVEGIVPAEGED